MTRSPLPQPSPPEFWTVVLATYGVHLAISAWRLSTQGFQGNVLLTDARLLTLLAGEVVLAVLLGRYLYVRGWRLEHFRFQLTLRQAGAGVVLWFVSYLAYAAVALLLLRVPAVRSAVAQVSLQHSITFPVAALLCVVNPAFEEFLNLGYLQQRLSHHGAAFAIGTAMLLRLLTHVYQGPVAVLSILPTGLVFGWYFWSRGKLFPVVFAHALADFLAFGLQRT